MKTSERHNSVGANSRSQFIRSWLAGLICLAVLLKTDTVYSQGNALTEQAVLKAITSGQKALIAEQGANGAWNSANHVTGTTALAALALLNCGMSPDDPPVRKALEYLRSIPDPDGTYEVSLLLMVYAAAKDSDDKNRMTRLVTKLEESQKTFGRMKGCWSYSTANALIDTNGDHSNGQFAVLGLYEAAMAGVPVSREVWESARDHWERAQCGDGGWGYASVGGNDSTGSMTVAGIAVQVMTSAMLRDDDKLDEFGNPPCCEKPEIDESLERGLRWMANHFSVARNPGSGAWKYYYLYGLERAGRLSGRRFFGESDWYRSGARQLIGMQNKRTGQWDPAGNATDANTATCFSLLFLSKGLAPVLINKLKHGPKVARKDDIDDWNRQPNDIRNLTSRLTGAENWPKLMTWQVVDLNQASEDGSVGDINQAPVLYLSGSNRPEFDDNQIELLREYVNLGGFILAVNNCGAVEFEESIKELIENMYPNGETSLQKLTSSHPVYRTENLLAKDGVIPEMAELWGADFGCRTAIMYSPHDLGCLWNHWSKLDPPDRPGQFTGRIELSMNIGTNIIAYATGREPVNKLKRQELANRNDDDSRVGRGLVQVAQVRHTGGWDTAPTAARNILTAVNRTVGLTASTEPATVLLSDRNLFDYSMLVMHGRNGFSTTVAEREQLKEYLSRGRLLMADACCGAKAFDRSFRRFIEDLYPERRLERIPVDHELFTSEDLHNLRLVKRRVAIEIENAALEGGVVNGPPFLEGIKIDGRYVVIYSKHDISCALERQASIACTGYVTDDAVRLSVNILLYSMLRKGGLQAGR